MQNNKVLSGLIWAFAERFGAQIVSFVVSIVLARILLPEDYGIIAMVMVFINIANAFVSGGFGNSLIQKKDADEMDFSTLFFFNVAFSIAIYCIIFFMAPYVENFYCQDGFGLIMRVLGIRLLLTGVNSIQRAYVARKMQFRKFFFATLGGTVFSAIIGIGLALKGYGVWALVFQYLTNTLIDTIVLFFTVRWRPKLIFDIRRLYSLLGYGWKLLCSSVLSSIYNEIYDLIIGKVYTSKDLAYYNRGNRFPNLIVTNINSSIETVIFPYLSKIQEEKKALLNNSRQIVKYSSYIIFPLIMGMAASGEQIIRVLLTDKWIAAYPYMVVTCLAYLVLPIGTANLQAIKAIGKSDVYFKIDVAKKTIGIIVLLSTIQRGVLAIAIGRLVANLFGFSLNIWANKKYIGYQISNQILDILSPLMMSITVFGIVYLENNLLLPDIAVLFIQIITGLVVYIGLSFLTKNECMKNLLGIFRKRG